MKELLSVGTRNSLKNYSSGKTTALSGMNSIACHADMPQQQFVKIKYELYDMTAMQV